ncbi:non-ribosomal peptide synthetase [Thalassobaculum sp. OXR-137]|uniref:non-ribosomal peptide synthetase n=1 Tax=Thalassobaculum sp. OXR-137 TaxID=3100173 RepID=UPI002AC91874|nr:non-ribosomal peptide synthetase [Thalassobaculum sp. OXR-137]WPZ32674.1 non-ribosomal peptide synthetase [Thalassobaculum sp. OXR-137]
MPTTTKTVIHAAFERVADAHPERIAIEASGRRIAYGDLNRAANRAAHGLIRQHGVGRGAVVGLHLPPGIAYVTAMLAVAKAGGIFLPLAMAAPPRRQEKILAVAAPALILTERPSDLPPGAATASPASLGAQDEANPPLAVAGDDAAYIVSTSGSTGAPKAILGSQKGLSHFIHWEVGLFGAGGDTRVSQLAPATFDVSLRDIFFPLLAGGTLCVPDDATRTDSRRLLAWLEASRVTHIHCVPSLFRQLTADLASADAAADRLPDLRHILLAGEPLYGADVQRWQALMGRRIELTNLYGPSETTLAKAFHRIGAAPTEPGRMVPVGLPLPNTSLLVIKDGELCDEGEIGEVFIKTPFMSKGYLAAPEETAAAFVQNPLTPGTPDTIYRSGDLGRYLAGHVVELLGRRDGQVKIAGTRIELAEVEGAILKHPAVRAAVVAVNPATARDPSLTAYYIADAPVAAADLRRHLDDWLPAAMQPAYLMQLDRFPLNLHGKVDRRALPRPADLLYRDAPYVAPQGETETRIAAIWGEVLELEKVGATHGFVDLGGDSLKAIRVLSRLYQAFGVEATLPDLFPHGTVRSLAATLNATLPAPTADPRQPAVAGQEG